MSSGHPQPGALPWWPRAMQARPGSLTPACHCLRSHPAQKAPEQRGRDLHSVSGSQSTPCPVLCERCSRQTEKGRRAGQRQCGKMSRPRLNPVFLTVSSGLCRPVAWGPDGRPAALLQPRDRDYIQAPMHVRRSVWRLQNYPACREGVSQRAGRWGTQCPEKTLHVCSPHTPAQRGCLSAARKCTQRPSQISLGAESLLSTKKQQPLTPVRLVFY